MVVTPRTYLCLCGFAKSLATPRIHVFRGLTVTHAYLETKSYNSTEYKEGAIQVWQTGQVTIVNETVLTILEVRLDQGRRHLFSPHPCWDSVNTKEENNSYIHFTETLIFARLNCTSSHKIESKWLITSIKFSKWNWRHALRCSCFVASSVTRLTRLKSNSVCSISLIIEGKYDNLYSSTAPEKSGGRGGGKKAMTISCSKRRHQY